MKLRHIAALVTGLGLAACAAPRAPFPGLPRLSVSTQFAIQNLCDEAVSPAIHLGGVPSGTASYRIQITDINVLIQTPWRETVPALSKTEIPEGAAKTYVGPCLGDMVEFVPIAPNGYQHRVEVLAEDVHGKPLAYGAVTVYVLSAYLTAKRERTLLQKQPQRGFPANQPSVPQPPVQSFQPVPSVGFPQGVGPSLGVYQ